MTTIFDPLRRAWVTVDFGNPNIFAPVPTRDELAEAVRKQEAIEAADKKEYMSQYIIWNPKSPNPPTVVQHTRPEAIRIAGRMAHENPGQEFYVCKLVNVASQSAPIPQPTRVVTYTDLEK